MKDGKDIKDTKKGLGIFVKPQGNQGPQGRPGTANPPFIPAQEAAIDARADTKQGVIEESVNFLADSTKTLSIFAESIATGEISEFKSDTYKFDSFNMMLNKLPELLHHIAEQINFVTVSLNNTLIKPQDHP